MFGLLSGLSAYSLLGLGTLSLALMLVYFSASGMFISLAMISHGWLEHRRRKWFMDTPTIRMGRHLAFNQLGLAVSLSVYAFWQMSLVNDEEVIAILFKDSVKPAFQMLDPQLQIELMKMLPTYVRAIYWGVFALAWLGCGATALYYLKATKKQVAQITSARASQ